MNSNPRHRDASSTSSARSRPGFSRRSFLARTGAVGGAAATAQVWLSGVTHGAPVAGAKTAVIINQRGGADALSICAPAHDPEYQMQRPTIRVLPPPSGNRAWLDPSETFAMSPGGLAADGIDWILPYEENHLCFVHGAGMMNQGRSHFNAMLHMEHGVNPGESFPVEGWAGRYLQFAPDSGSPVRGFSHGNLLPTALRGGPSTSPVANVATLAFPGPDGDPGPVPTAQFREYTISESYKVTPFAAAMLSGDAAFATLDELTSVTYPTPGAGAYPDTPLGNALANTAAIIKDPMVHVEVVHIDIGGWDHHTAQDPNNAGGRMYDLLNQLSVSIGAFYDDLNRGAGVDQYLLFTYTEFGRQIKENANQGTDHGYGSMMAVMGSGVQAGAGGTVFAEFGPIASAYDPINGDALIMTIDYRDVLKEALQNQLCLDSMHLDEVFPMFTPRPTPPGIIG